MRINLLQTTSGFSKENEKIRDEEIDNKIHITLTIISIINSPTRFIVRETPTNSKSNKVIRYNNKPKYRVLNPNQIKIRYNIQRTSKNNEEGVPRRPYNWDGSRRGTWRTYRNKRYKKMRGKEVWIHAIWHNPSEGTLGNLKYKVLLDK